MQGTKPTMFPSRMFLELKNFDNNFDKRTKVCSKWAWVSTSEKTVYGSSFLIFRNNRIVMQQTKATVFHNKSFYKWFFSKRVLDGGNPVFRGRKKQVWKLGEIKKSISFGSYEQSSHRSQEHKTTALQSKRFLWLKEFCWRPLWKRWNLYFCWNRSFNFEKKQN